MSSPFVAEIRIFACNFAPTGWALCNGQLLPISQNTALFSLLGTSYGGNGQNNFALPNLQGAAPMHWGQGAGLSLRDIGEVGGSQSVTLLSSEIPAHSHALAALDQASSATVPAADKYLAGGASKTVLGVPKPVPPAFADPASLVAMEAQSLTIAGGGLPHNNVQPYLVLNFCIALQGVYPPRG